MLRKKLIAVSSAVLMVIGIVAGTTAAYAGSGKITMELVKAAFIVGGTGGKGTLTFNGQNYPLSIGGFSAGWGLSLTAINLSGNVKNINQPEDIEGVYSAASAGAAVAAGAKAAVMVNGKGVALELVGTQLGVDLSIDLTGLKISLKR